MSDRISVSYSLVATCALGRSTSASSSGHLAGTGEDGRGENACAGRLKWRRPHAFALSGFFTVAYLYLLLSVLARATATGRPFRYSFVSWRLPSCPLTILFSLSLSLRPPFGTRRSPFPGLLHSLPSFHCRLFEILCTA